jgi:imidazolonepropionase-like amidohydrolase
MVSANPTPSPTLQTRNPSQSNGAYHILAGKLFDPHSRKLVLNQVISVDKNNGTILGVQDHAKFVKPGNEELIDLRHLTILPGLVDAHVHRQYLIQS